MKSSPSTAGSCRPLCWSIAGFDGGGGAGVLADLETFSRLEARGRAAVTAVTAQGKGGIGHLQPVSAASLRRQLDCLLEEGRPQAVKIGMLGRAALVEALADWLEEHLPADLPLVLDPVLAASAGGQLLEPRALPLLRRRLIARATVITPNRAEAQALLGGSGACSTAQMARRLLDLGCRAAVITGGDGRGPARDVLADASGVRILLSARLPVTAHGTGCRFSSALAVWLGRGAPLVRAARLAGSLVRAYLRQELHSRMRSQ